MRFNWISLLNRVDDFSFRLRLAYKPGQEECHPSKTQQFFQALRLEPVEDACLAQWLPRLSQIGTRSRSQFPLGYELFSIAIHVS